jgi:tetratricopeptide (TPR) repeat protein
MKMRTTPPRAWLAGALSRRLCAVAFLFAPSSVLSNYQIPSNAAQDNGAETHAAEGLAFAKAGSLQSAEAELRKAVALAPANADFLEDLATVLAMEKKFDESTSYFQRTLKINPQNTLARRYLAANLWQTHRYAEARQNLRMLLNANPGDPEALLLLGMVSENTKDYATAAKTLASVPTLVRAQPESIAALARSYYHVGEREKARAWLNELQNNPDGVKATLLGVQIADEMQDYETAATLLSSLQPDTTGQLNLNYRLAVVKFHAKQFDESERLLQQLLQEHQTSGEIERLLASCYLAQSRPQDAIHLLQEAVELEPANVTNYLELGDILLANRRIIPALEMAKRTANAFPDSSRAFLFKGQAELEAAYFTDAVGSFTRAVHLDPANPDGTIGLARAQMGAGTSAQAKATLERAIRSSPEKARFELELALLLLKEAETGDKDAEAKAERLLKSAVARDNTLAEAHYQLGSLALQRGPVSSALIYLQTAAKLEPESAKVHFALSRAYRRLGQNEEAARQAALYDKLKEKETPRDRNLSPDGPSSN